LLIDTNLADDAELGTFAIGEAYGVLLARKKLIGQTVCSSSATSENGYG